MKKVNVDIALVSICIPTYNGADFIAEALTSAMQQTYSNIEIIISDDASVDTTLEIINSFKTKSGCPIHVHNHIPNGIGANWNHCIKNAKGDYIKFLFQDDVLLPECVEKMVAVIEGDETIGLVASKREFIFESSYLNEDIEKWIDVYKDLQSGLNLKWTNGLAYLDHSLFSTDVFFESPLNKIGEPPTIIFRKDLVNTIGYFREDLNQVLDYEFCYRVLKNKRIAIIEEKLIKFRLHGNQATVKNNNNNIYGRDHSKLEYIIYKKYLKYLSPYWRKVLLRKHNPFVSKFYDSIDAVRNFFSKKNK